MIALLRMAGLAGLLGIVGSGVAHAGGGGLYVEVAPGAAWTDYTGPITRGSSASLSTGVFWGPYKATLQYGRYNRAGLNVRLASAAPWVQGPEVAILSVGPEFGSGIDLLKAGGFWRVAITPAVFVPDVGNDMVDFDDMSTWDFGVTIRATGAAVWWFGRNVGLVGRFEAGPQYASRRNSITISGGIGIGLLFRAGAVFGGKRQELEREAEREIDQGTVEEIPWETPPAGVP